MRKILVLALCSTLCLWGCGANTDEADSAQAESTASTEPAQEESYEDVQELIGTVVQVKAYGAQAEEAVQAAFTRAKELEQIFSSTVEDSEINTMNEKAKSGETVTISDELYTVLTRALYYGAISDGALDCTIGDLIDLWGIGTDHAAVPQQAEIDALLRSDGWDDYVLDGTDRTITFENGQVTIQTGAIAKGYISDEMKAVLQEYDITSAVMSLGGNVMTIGTKTDGSDWNVAITDPFNPDDIIGKVSVEDKAVVTSGNYEKYFEEDGVRYHHILNPETGYPADSDVVSTTIIASNGIDCDALSTATYILGAEKGMDLVNSLEDVEAVFILEDGSFVTSEYIDRYDFQEITE